MSEFRKEMRERARCKISDARYELKRMRAPRNAPPANVLVALNQLGCLRLMIEDLLAAEKAIDSLKRAEEMWDV